MTEYEYQDVLKLTEKLVSFNSIESQPDEIMNCLRFIKAYFAKTPYKIHYTNKNNHPVIIVSSSGKRHHELIFSGHIDVADIGQEFTRCRIHEDKMFGSGTLDMKSGVASMMYAMKKYYHDTNNIGDVCLIITSDEELGGRDGLGYILQKQNYRCDFAIISEGRHKYDIITREKGILQTKFIASGEAIHGAYHAHKNPVLNLLDFLKHVVGRFPNVRNEWASSCNVTTFHAGNAINAVPASAEATCDIRFVEKSDYSLASCDEIKSFIESVAPKYDIKIKYLVYGNVFYVDETSKDLNTLKAIACSVTNRTVEFDFNNGSSDARYFQDYNIPVAILGPEGGGHHSVHEWVDIKSVHQHTEVLLQFMRHKFDR